MTDLDTLDHEQYIKQACDLARLGMDADLLVFDPTETYTVTASDNASRADYSIYEDREVTGRIRKTFRRGELIADDGEITAEHGSGQFVARAVPDWTE